MRVGLLRGVSQSSFWFAFFLALVCIVAFSGAVMEEDPTTSSFVSNVLECLFEQTYLLRIFSEVLIARLCGNSAYVHKDAELPFGVVSVALPV